MTCPKSSKASFAKFDATVATRWYTPVDEVHNLQFKPVAELKLIFRCAHIFVFNRDISWRCLDDWIVTYMKTKELPAFVKRNIEEVPR